MTDELNDVIVDERELPVQVSYSPDDISLALYGREHAFQQGKRVRAWLRSNATRPASEKGKSWVLTPELAQHVFDVFANEKVTLDRVIGLDALTTESD
jgi:hypothetical protein